MIRDLKPYPACKYSGAPRLGEVPEHWEVRRLKQVCRFAYGDALAAEMREHGSVPVYGSNGPVGFHSSANTEAPCLIIGRKGSFGKVNFSSEPVFAIDTTFFVDRRISDADVRWLFYLLGWLRLDEVSRDSAVPGLDRVEAYQQIVTMPPFPEQAGIVRFLDHADRRIRRYIHAKQKLIKLLKEQEQTKIYQAVTRGLDPNVRLKPSGVEWLGDVPERWEVRRLKTLVRRIDQGVSPQAESYLADGNAWGVLKAGCVNHGVFKEREHKRLPGDYAFDPILAVAPGDVLVSRASGSPHLVGSVGRVSSISYKVILSDKIFRPVFYSQDVDPDFMVLAMNSRYYRQQVEQAISGAEGLANNLPLSSLRGLIFAIPPVEEQQAIIEYLRGSTEQLRATLAQAEREIPLLREYRSRLISDVVTGKLDVREVAAQLLPEEADELEESLIVNEAVNGDEAELPSDELAEGEVVA